MDLIIFNRTNENIEITYLTKKNNSYRNNIKELFPGSYTITDIVPGSNVKIKIFSAEQKIQAVDAKYAFFDENTNKHIYQLDTESISGKFFVTYEIDSTCSNNGYNSDDLLPCTDDGFHGDCADFSDYCDCSDNCDCSNTETTYATCENCANDEINCDCNDEGESAPVTISINRPYGGTYFFPSDAVEAHIHFLPHSNDSANLISGIELSYSANFTSIFYSNFDVSLELDTIHEIDITSYLNELSTVENKIIYMRLTDKYGSAYTFFYTVSLLDYMEFTIELNTSLPNPSGEYNNNLMYLFSVKNHYTTWADWLLEEDTQDSNYNNFISLSEDGKVLFNNGKQAYLYTKDADNVVTQHEWTSTDLVPYRGEFYINDPTIYY